MARRFTPLLLACVVLCLSCGKKPAHTRPPAYVNETPVPTLGKPWTVPDLGLELVFVEAGSFMMGSEDVEDDEKPVHEVRITRPFWVGKYEVTQAQYEALTGQNPSWHRKGKEETYPERHTLRRKTVVLGETSGFPVECVSWEDAAAFCGELTVRERQARRLPDGYEFRLPTEAEWEYAARGGARSREYTYAGSHNAKEAAWCVRDRYSESRAHQVGGKKPNELGVYDMSGNVSEMCLDWYGPDYYASSPRADPRGPPAAQDRVYRGPSDRLRRQRLGRVSRGGYHDQHPTFCRVGRRGRAMMIGVPWEGFRVVLGPVLQPEARLPAP